MQNVINSLLWISLYSFYLNQELTYLAAHHLIIRERTISNNE
jgi:hypothetical protein